MRQRLLHALSLICLLLMPIILRADPNISISPQLHGQHVTWHSEIAAVKATLYLTNHEPYAVICDGEMKTNKDEKQRLEETRIPAGKTIPLVFRYTRSITGVHIMLVCVPSEEEKALVDKEGKLEGSNMEKTSDRIITRKLEQEKKAPVSVPVEDLNRF